MVERDSPTPDTLSIEIHPILEQLQNYLIVTQTGRDVKGRHSIRLLQLSLKLLMQEADHLNGVGRNRPIDKAQSKGIDGINTPNVGANPVFNQASLLFQDYLNESFGLHDISHRTSL